MTGIGEMRGIAYAAVLEIFCTEFVVVYADSCCICHVENRNAMAATGSLKLANHLGKHRAIYSPGGYDTYTGLGATLFDSRTEIVEAIGKLLPHSIVFYLVSVIMTGNNEYVVGIGRYLAVAHSHLFAKAFFCAVEGDAIAVAAQIVVLHTEFDSSLGMPGFFLGTAVIAHIAITNHPQRLTGQKVIGSTLGIRSETTYSHHKGEKKVYNEFHIT